MAVAVVDFAPDQIVAPLYGRTQSQGAAFSAFVSVPVFGRRDFGSPSIGPEGRVGQAQSPAEFVEIYIQGGPGYGFNDHPQDDVTEAGINRPPGALIRVGQER